MKVINCNSYNGWFVGNFKPNLIASEELEFGYKKIPAGTDPDFHYHKHKTEYTILIEGKIELQFNKQIITPIATIILYPNEKNDQHFIEDSLILIINTPSKTGDKHY